MSAAKRRRQAQIARLVRLDRTHQRLYLMASKHRDGERARQLWCAVIVPLGDKLGEQAWHALPRCETGRAILRENYRRRRHV